MKRLVALDTSTWWGGVALLESTEEWRRPVLIGEVGLQVGDSHAAHVLVLLDHLLAAAAWPKSSVDAYVATRGPGSFTGLRVGLGTIRGFALASGRPCIGVGTLDAMAEALGPAEGDRVPLLDAGREEVYGARFDASSSPPETRVEPWVGPPDLALRGSEAEPIIFGPGAEAHRSLLAAAGWRGHPKRTPTSVAAAAGRLALWALARGVETGHGMSPLYLRPPDAELKAREA